MLKLFHNNMSVCSQKVRMLLDEKSIKTEKQYLNLRKGDQQNPEYLKLNPKAYVPTLVDDGRPVIESTVICEYLDEKYPETKLTPDDPYLRSSMRLWTMIPDAYLHDACIVLSNTIAFREQWLARPAEELEKTIRQTPDPYIRERRRDVIYNGVESARFSGAVVRCRNLLLEMAELLENQTWLNGEDYSLADIALIPYVVRLEELQFSELWVDCEHLNAWIGRMKARPAFQTAFIEYFETDYLELMAAKGKEYSGLIAAIWNGQQG